ncbi:polynucleotide adenylyltransferase PcnB [Ectothiorhodospiraceae bacterium BW-2]|nr:polynucleotide adenylyltransferase PcnB [Ectothiorhodospiraceae bacterium BW-2]
MIRWIKRKLALSRASVLPVARQPQRVAAAQLNIGLEQMGKSSVKVMQKLHQAGFEVSMVGGGVRDLLLRQRPKDFDIVTNARPEQVRSLFRNSRLIGRRFRLAHVYFGNDIVEVATYRGSDESGQKLNDEGMVLRDNVYGDLQSDAWRRDFTVNALYFEFASQSVIDYTGGLEDLNQRKLVTIGEPLLRFREDPVRMIRAVRFAAKLDLQPDRAIDAAIEQSGALLQGVSPSRLFDEAAKLFLTGHGEASFRLLRTYELLPLLYPHLNETLLSEPITARFIKVALQNSDRRVAEGRPVTPAFLLAALLWPQVNRLIEGGDSSSGQYLQQLQQIGDEVLTQQQRYTAGPRRHLMMARDIWVVQHRLILKRQPERTLANPSFRAAFDFLQLRALAGEEELQPLVEWWEQFQLGSAPERQQIAVEPSDERRRRRRRRGPGRTLTAPQRSEA